MQLCTRNPTFVASSQFEYRFLAGLLRPVALQKVTKGKLRKLMERNCDNNDFVRHSYEN